MSSEKILDSDAVGQSETILSYKHPWLLVFVLMLAYAIAFVDRYILNLLVEPMKRDFALSDTQISLLLGGSFAIFYAVLGLPLGRLVDMRNRKKIIAVGISLWSLMVAFSGFAKSYFHLLLSRIGVGVGEASLSPAAYSMLSDVFPKNRLATAISVYSLGIYIGSALAYILGSYCIGALDEMGVIELILVGEIYAWQLIFILVGLPGLLITGVVLLLKEPSRKVQDLTVPSSIDTLKYLWNNCRAFFWICGGFAAFYCSVYATMIWLPAYLMRVRGLSVEEVGLISGIGMIVLPTIGILIAGRLGDHWTSKGIAQAKTKLVLGITILFIPATFIYVLMPSTNLALYALIPYGLLVSGTVGVGAAMVQELLPNRMRGLGTAILLFMQNLIGLGLGPTLVALLTDYVFEDEMALGDSLAICSVVVLVVALICFYRALSLMRKAAIE